MEFTEPWFLGKKLQLSVDVYRHDLAFQSIEDLYTQVETGARVGLTKALGSDYLIGSVGYTLEDVGILLNGRTIRNNEFGVPIVTHTAIPNAIKHESGYNLVSKLDLSLAYDTRNSVTLPDKGQLTKISTILAGPFPGDKDYYK